MGGRCGVQVWAHGGLQPLDLNHQKGQLPRGCPQGSQARCEHVTCQLQSKDGGEQRRNREDVWILTLPAPGQVTLRQVPKTPVRDPGKLKHPARGCHISEPLSKSLGKQSHHDC